MVGGILHAVSTTLTDFEYQHEYVDDANGHALIFTAMVDGLQVHGCDFIHLNDDGLIDQFTIMLRPLSASKAMAAQMAPKYAEMVKALGQA
ncbi:hypothetical protein [Gordonia hydrophobica]|uniref:SnoaL-like domain-containing protein n=1 Tax=Gordonia hydrophobica TaxID=40516 RepID=A0ABZ2U5X8_9ACTN|nr:hypothetical protein [Gordonia hydrophobica]MBM7365628.1 hypothetical protein [Gordonia hydrophobica]